MAGDIESWEGDVVKTAEAGVDRLSHLPVGTGIADDVDVQGPRLVPVVASNSSVCCLDLSQLSPQPLWRGGARR